MFKYLRKILVNNFAFSYKETNAFLILLILVFISLIMLFVLPGLLTQSYDNLSKDAKNLERYLSDLENNIEDEEEAITFQFKNFDPNKVSEGQLHAMKLPPRVINNLIKYREKGGYFKYKKQLKKIYGLDDSLFILISPYVQIDIRDEIKQLEEKEIQIDDEQALTFNKGNFKKRVKPRIALFDLNQADTSQLKKIYGIGPVIANRIIKFRYALGGFIHQDQLTEVYGLSPAVVNEITKYSFIDKDYEPKKLKINFASIGDLSRHPYLSFEEAKNIVNYRTINGPFKTVENLIESQLIDQAKIDKVTNYLQF
jgi:competence protein ComEA